MQAQEESSDPGGHAQEGRDGAVKPTTVVSFKKGGTKGKNFRRRGRQACQGQDANPKTQRIQ
ncbi:unnamed protein product [Discosporangium mesarthrocarpum]